MPKYNLQYIANNIRQRRESLQYSQFYVAYRMGCGQNAFSKIELGHTRITLDKLFAIADALETDLITLVTRPANATSNNQSTEVSDQRLQSAG